MSDAAPFVSVKLSAALVNQAREAAQTMRRSVASQIEYWATLGKALENAGLTTGDSHALIARQDRASYTVGRPAALSAELDALHGHVLALAKSGSLNQRTREATSGQTDSAPIAAKSANKKASTALKTAAKPTRSKKA